MRTVVAEDSGAKNGGVEGGSGAVQILHRANLQRTEVLVDLLPDWLQIPVVSMRAVAVDARGEPDETMSSKDDIHQEQQQDRK